MIDKVKFKKPNFKKLKKEGFTFVDMHMHTEYSDTTTKINEIIKRANKFGYGFSVTDHNEIGGCLEAERKIDKKTLFIPGIEITTKELCHLLLYFYDIKEAKEYFDKYVKDFRYSNPYMPISKTTEELVEYSKDYNCISSAAHPFANPKRYSFVHKLKTKEIRKRVVKKIDAIEVLCGHNLRNMNTKAVEWCEKLEKQFTAGSDSHVLLSQGSVLTYSYAETREEFLDNIRWKKNFVIGKEMSIPMRILPITKLANEHLKFFGPTMKFQFDYNIKRPSVDLKNKMGKMNEKRKDEKKVIKAKLIDL